MALTYTGQLAGKRVSKFEGKERTQLQFMESKPDGSIGFLEIKVPDGMNPDKYAVGQKVTVPVEYKLVRDKIYWAVINESPGFGASSSRSSLA